VERKCISHKYFLIQLNENNGKVCFQKKSHLMPFLMQIGALGMALNGSSFENILSHYFHSTELKNIYD
jgi:hypothetical protein